MGNFTRCIHSEVITAAFINGAPVFFLAPSSAFLDAANQFILLALDELQLVMCKFRKTLFKLSFGDIPISFGDKYAHTMFSLFVLLPPHQLDAV
jgi:hypothetical protein